MTIADVLMLIGEGMRLRVPHDPDGVIAIVEGLKDKNRGAIPITSESSDRLIEMGMIRKLAEEEWRESGYDGDVADWYDRVQ